MSHPSNNPGGKKFLGEIRDGLKEFKDEVTALVSMTSAGTDQPSRSRSTTCRRPGCSKPCYKEGNGRIHDYCGKTHAHEHKVILMNEEATRQTRSRAKRGGGKQDKHDWGQGQQLVNNTSGTAVWNTHHHHQQQGWNLHQQHQQQGWFQGDHGYPPYSPWNPDGPIYFYNRDEPYYEFTNFHNGAPIKLDGKEWKTTEHYFQAQKFVGTPYVELIRKAFGPRDAFNHSRDASISHWRRSDWEEVKMNVMRKALFAKFTQNDWLKTKLLGTGDRKLVERSPYDSFWGDGGNGTGENHLGKLLMELRSKLRGEDTQRDGIKGSQPGQGDNASVRYETQTSGPAASSSMSSGNLSSDELARRPLHSTDTETKDEKMQTVDDLINLDDSGSDQHKELTFPEHMKPSPIPLSPEPAAQGKPTESPADEDMDTTQ